MTTHEGGCHCGRVRFRVAISERVALACNCSLCSKKGLLHAIVPAADFHLLSGDEHLATYTFNTGVAKHRFCRICGVQSFYVPRSHPDCIDVNVRCLDAPVDEFEIRAFDGRNWESNVDSIR